MKKLLFLSLTISLCFQAKSQNYVPMFETGRYWQVGVYDPSICDLASAQRYNLAGDTLIDDMPYRKFTVQHIYSEYTDPFCPPYYVSPIIFYSSLLMYEDIENQRVYQRMEEANVLVYDFSLEVGDTLVHGSGNTEINAIVTDISYDNSFTDGIERRVFTLNPPDWGSESVIVYEGIGGEHGLFTPFEIAIGSGHTLMCMGDTLSETSIFGYCSPLGVGVDEISMNKFNLYPNPCTSYFEISFVGLQTATVKILNLSGQILESHQMKGENLRLEIGHLAKGLYFVSLETEGGIAVKKMVVN